MDKEAKINIGFLIVFLILLVVLMIYGVVAPSTSDHHKTNATIAEDKGFIFNFSINHSGNVARNLTGVNITIPENFIFLSGSNSSTNLSTSGYVGVLFTNTSISLMWNTTTPTNVIVFESEDANATGGGYNNSFFGFNATAGTPGLYNITIRLLFNNTGNGTLAAVDFNETNIAVIVNDTTAPHEINISSSGSDFGLNRSYANVSGVIMINLSVLDNGNFTGYSSTSTATDIQYVNVSFWRGGTLNASYRAVNISGRYWNVSVNTSTLDDGVYNITVYVNDTRNNRNDTNVSLNVRIDNTAPTATISCTPTTVNAGETVTCTCSPSDSTSGVNTTATSVTANPSTSNTGTFTESCSYADMSGNIGNKVSTTFVVELGTTFGGARGGAGGAGVTTEFYTKTFSVGQPLNELKILTQQLAEKQRVEIKINEEIHHVGVRELTPTSIVIEIASHEPIQVKLNVGEDAKTDVDHDGIYDVYVKLNSIVNGKADLNIEYIQEAVPPELLPPEEEEEAAAEEEEEAPEEINLVWLWIVIVVIIIVAVVFWLLQRKK